MFAETTFISREDPVDGSRPDRIPTTLRLLAVIEEVARAGVPVTPTSVNEALGLPKPTIHRLFSTLEDEGFLSRDLDGRSYAPGPRLTALAANVLSAQDLREARSAVLTRVSGEIGETCNIALSDGDAMVYVQRVETKWPLRIQLPTGTRVPLHCTASGKLYLASLPARQRKRLALKGELRAYTSRTLTEIRRLSEELDCIAKQGYALDREEFMEGMIALAVPILAPGDRLLATLSFHAPRQRLSIDDALGYLETLRSAAADLADLTNRSTP